MGKRKISIKESVATNIAAIAWYIESKGLLAAAEKFSDDAYAFIGKLEIKEEVMPFVVSQKGQSLVINAYPIKENTL